MIHADILVVGAGACGLMAARELSASGKKVIIIEARKQAGGRIHTLDRHPFSQPAEGGAEFVHGNLPETLGLLNQYNIPYTKMAGTMLRKVNGKWQHTDEEVEGWDAMIQQMNSLQHDMTLSQFLTTYFGDKQYEPLRQSAIQFAQGFDVADEEKVSVLALRDEWQHEQDDQYRLPGGYMQLVDALTATCLSQGCEIHFSEPVQQVVWQKKEVTVTTAKHTVFNAQQIIVTVPLGVWQQEQIIAFEPAIPDIISAARHIGFGNVIKVLIEFERPFWKDIRQDALFFFSNEKIPTWWTQFPAASNLLTGWLGGPATGAMQQHSPDQIMDTAIASLRALFDVELPPIKAWHVANWQNEPFIWGAYSYNTIGAPAAKKILQTPVQNTIYFAGEAVYTGHAQGTVEAALASAKNVAAQVLKG